MTTTANLPALNLLSEKEIQLVNESIIRQIAHCAKLRDMDRRRGGDGLFYSSKVAQLKAAGDKLNKLINSI